MQTFLLLALSLEMIHFWKAQKYIHSDFFSPLVRNAIEEKDNWMPLAHSKTLRI